MISNVSEDLAKALELGPRQKSLGIVTADTDDVLYTALDEATKDADVEVVYAKSMYAGAANASTKLAGEVIGIIGGPSPAEIRSGLNSIRNLWRAAPVLSVPMKMILLSTMPTQYPGQVPICQRQRGFLRGRLWLI